jgi:group I intron endonuclease
MKSGIYKIINKKNNVVYVGQSENLNTRFNRHIYRLKRNEHHNESMQRAFNKHGEDIFEYEIIEEVELELLTEREKYWIDYYGGINSNNNYNFKDPLLNEYSDYIKKKQSKKISGENNPNWGNKWTEEQKEKMSKFKKGKTLEEFMGKERAELTREKMSKSQTGRKHPEEVKEKIRKANSGEKNPSYGKGYKQLGENNPNWGNKWTEEQKEKMSKFKKGKTLEEFMGKERAELTREKMSKSQTGRKHPEEVKEKIRKANSGEKNPSYGKGYKQLGENNPNWGNKSINRKPILCLTKSGDLIKEYEFLSQIKEDGFNPSNAMYCANGKKSYNFHKGFIWKWKDSGSY